MSKPILEMKMFADLLRLLLFLVNLTLNLGEETSLSVGCIDESDCASLGHKYSCYLYRCLNWVDRSTEFKHCQKGSLCPPGQKCYR